MKESMITLGVILFIGVLLDMAVALSYTPTPNSFIINTLTEALLASSAIALLFSRRVY